MRLVDTGHVTPKVWDGPNSGKSSFGDVTLNRLTIPVRDTAMAAQLIQVISVLEC